MTTWITQLQAAEILGVHTSAVAKMVARGELTTRGAPKNLPSLDRDQVEALALQRAEAAASLEAARQVRLASLEANHHRPPDAEHDWLTLSQAGAVLGITREAVDVRCKRGTMPYEWSGGWRWIRRDLLELRERARAAQRSRTLGEYRQHCNRAPT